MSNKNNTDTTISKSKQKRLAQEAARKAQRKQKAMATFWAIFIPLVIVLAIVAAVLYYKSLQVDYEKYLADDGSIQGITASDYITGSYEDMLIDSEAIAPDQDSIEDDILSALDEHKTLNKESTTPAITGDTVNITYVASLNGETYDQALIEDGGEDIVLGNADIDEAIDSSIEEHIPGDSFNVTVSYPADYDDEELAGNNIIYDITLTGIYEIPEFTDEFVQTYYSDVASNAAEYRQSIAMGYYSENLKDEIEDSISLNCVVNQYPDKYLENTEKTLKAQDKETVAYYKQMGLQIDSIKQLYGFETDAEYNDQILKNAQESVMKTLFYQKVMNENGLTNTEEEVKTYFLSHDYDEASYNQAVTRYGYKYMANMALKGRMLDYVYEQLSAKYPLSEATSNADDTADITEDVITE